MEFERAVYEDIPALMTLRLAYLLEDYGEISAETCSVMESNLSGYFQKHLNHDFFAYVCRTHNEIVACCFLYVSEKPANPSFVHGKTGTVMNVYTMPEYRKRGIAETVLREPLNNSARAGGEGFWLSRKY